MHVDRAGDRLFNHRLALIREWLPSDGVGSSKRMSYSPRTFGVVSVQGETRSNLLPITAHPT
jgi:hypothetical protein